MPSPTEIAAAYLAAWRCKDIAAIGACLHPEAAFTGPMARTQGKDAILASCERMFPMLTDIEPRACFADGGVVVGIYDFVCAEPIGRCRTAEMLSVDDGLITSIELFFDARPFEAAARPRTAA